MILGKCLYILIFLIKLYKNLISILSKHSIRYDKLLDNNTIKIKDNCMPNWKIPLLKDLILARDNLIVLPLNKSEIDLVIYVRDPSNI